MRSEFQKGLSSPKAVRSMLPDSEQIIREWLENLNIQDNETIEDMLPELSRLNLERKYSNIIINMLKSKEDVIV